MSGEPVPQRRVAAAQVLLCAIAALAYSPWFVDDATAGLARPVPLWTITGAAAAALAATVMVLDRRIRVPAGGVVVAGVVIAAAGAWPGADAGSSHEFVPAIVGLIATAVMFCAVVISLLASVIRAR